MKQILVHLLTYNDFETEVIKITDAINSGTWQDILIHVFSGRPEDEYTLNIAHKLRQKFPDAKITGTMSAGEIKSGHLMERGVLISLVLFETTSVQLLRFDNVKDKEAEVGAKICNALNSIEDIQAAEMIFPGTEFDTRSLFNEMSQCQHHIEIFGGYSGGHEMNTPDHFLFDEKSRLYDTVIVCAFSGKDFHINVDKSIGWEPLGLPFKVTKADGNRLIELNGRPASEVYESFLQIDRNTSDNAYAGYTFPFLTKYKDEQWLRSAIHIEKDGSLSMHGFVNEGMEIQLSYGNPNTIFSQINNRLQTIRKFCPQVINLYSCIVRKAFWEDYVDVELEPFEQIASTTGIFTWGEIIRNTQSGEIVEHNVTLLSVAMREGNAEKESLPEVKINDSIIKGPFAQMRRLTGMVYSTMGELEKAHEDLRFLNHKLSFLAEHDPLTGLYNRGKTEELISSAMTVSAKSKRPLGLIMIDIDHFKNINDTYGHQTGDLVLKEVAAILNETARNHTGALAGRWGGEEFFIAIPNISSEDNFTVAENLRKRIEVHNYADIDHVTISLGIISVIGSNNRQAVFSAVDAALYRAKENGRNCVVQAEL